MCSHELWLLAGFSPGDGSRGVGGVKRVGPGYSWSGSHALRLPLAAPAPGLNSPMCPDRGASPPDDTGQCLDTPLVVTTGDAPGLLWGGAGMPRHSPVHRTAAKTKNPSAEVPIVPRPRNAAQGGAAPAAHGEGLELPPPSRADRCSCRK